MFKLKILNQDGSIYWVEHFNEKDQLDKWLKEEQERPYWKKDYICNIIEDVPKQIEIDPFELKVLSSKLLIDKGILALSAIRTLNEQKFESGILNIEKFMQLIEDPEIKKIQFLLSNGALDIAKAMIINLKSEYYSEEEKQKVLKYL